MEATAVVILFVVAAADVAGSAVTVAVEVSCDSLMSPVLFDTEWLVRKFLIVYFVGLVAAPAVSVGVILVAVITFVAVVHVMVRFGTVERVNNIQELDASGHAQTNIFLGQCKNCKVRSIGNGI